MIFETADSSEIAIPPMFIGRANKRWSNVSLSFHKAWYFVVYDLQTEEGVDENNIIFCSISDQIAEMLLVKNLHIKDVYLVSPGYLNGSDSWKMENVKEVWKAELNNDVDGTARVYVLADGREYVHSLCTMDKNDFNKHEIIFEINK